MILSTLFSFRDFLCLDDLVMNPFVAGFFAPLVCVKLYLQAFGLFISLFVGVTCGC